MRNKNMYSITWSNIGNNSIKNNIDKPINN